MSTTRTTTLSQNESQKNGPKVSPSKVKLDIHKEAGENEEEDEHVEMRSSIKKTKKSKKKQKQEQ